MAFDRLLAPGRLGPLELPNKLAMAPMGVNLPGAALDAWFEARARGGAGLVIVGSVSVAHPAGSFDHRQAQCATDAGGEALGRIADAVHRHGSKLAAQLVHAGSQALLDIAEGRPLLVPSRKSPVAPDELSTMLTPDELGRVMAPFAQPGARMAVHEATDDDLAEVVDRFTAAARRAVGAGADGIELHAGHGYLIHSFLSPFTNRRTDRWGGDAAGRAALLVEVVRAVRAVVPVGFPVWARIGADERHREPAQRYPDALVAMRLAVEAGLDAVHVTAYAEPNVATGITDGHTPHWPGALLPLAARVRADLGVPVVAMGRLTPEAAEQALADGAADVIAMGRPLIADPDLPAKLRAGRRDRVRPCAYQYRCIGSIFTNDPVTCSVNPDAGHESDQPVRAAAARRVVVVGAGPAGLECARRLAERGHDVEVWEATDGAGGMLRLAERVDADLLGLADWLLAAATDAGVRFRFGVRADAGSLAGADLDAVVWAIGATWPGRPAVEQWLRTASANRPRARSATQEGGERSEGRSTHAVPVAVRGSGKAAVSVALAVAEGGARAVLDPGDATVLAPELGLPGRFRLVAAARAAGVVEAPGAADDGGDVLDLRPAGAATSPPALEGIAVHLIGDASGTSGLAAAMTAARRVANEI